MKLLTVGNPKLMKGEKKGYLSFILHLAPSKLSGYNTCPSASNGCAAACLNTAGRGGLFPSIQEARIRKTRWFFEDRDTFMAQLVKDVTAGIKLAERKGLIPVFRLNGTSDIRWEHAPVTVTRKVWGQLPLTVEYPNIMSAFPDVQFYDYTKLANRVDIPANYHLTFSRSEINGHQLPTISHNIAVVFDTAKGKPLPTEYLGRPVVDGDETDLRFLDGVGVIVGLRGKGKAKNGDHNGFVVLTRKEATV
jgi:hypothetical protein